MTSKVGGKGKSAPPDLRSRWIGALCAALTALIMMATIALIGSAQTSLLVIALSAALIASATPYILERLNLSVAGLEFLSKLTLAGCVLALLTGYIIDRY